MDLHPDARRPGQFVKQRLPLLLAAALVSLAASAGEVYKWVDADGVVHFTNIRPDDVRNYATLRFPCYASDPACRRVDWEKVPLDTRTF